MPRTVEVRHQVWIAAPLDTVRAQFLDLYHHIESNVHPRLKFEVLAQDARQARFTQEVRLLGIRQKDTIARTIHDDGSIRDESVDGFTKGATLDFRFVPAMQADRPGTQVDIQVRVPTPPLLGWLAPLLEKQVRRELTEAAVQDKQDIERGYPRQGGPHH